MKNFYLPWPSTAPDWAWDYANIAGVSICCFDGFENALEFHA